MKMNRIKEKRWIATLLLSLTMLGGIPLAAKTTSRLWKAGDVVSEKMVRDRNLGQWFTCEPVSDAVFARMRGKSYPTGCEVPRTSLRYLKVIHYDGKGNIRKGEMVCNKRIANDLVAIFRELFAHRYPIERMCLIDDFDAVDERSMRANNSTCFCFRLVRGSAKLSGHARGMAVDINPLYNPYYRKYADGRVVVQPSNALRYCDRRADFPYKIDRGDLLYKVFVRHGFRWGGDWHSLKDYQHFEK